jgi:hypothetical protein
LCRAWLFIATAALVVGAVALHQAESTERR